MMKDDVDRILSAEQEITPSCGFVSEVMIAVQREAEAPPPIAFPWRRALPGMTASVLGLVMLMVAGRVVVADAQGATLANIPPAVMSALVSAQHMGAGWIAAALLVSFACVKFAQGFAVGRG